MHNNKVSHQITFEKLFRQYIETSRPKLLSYVLRLLPVSEAEEVLQEAHLKFYCIALQQASLDKANQSLTQYTPLLFSIAKNLALSRIRHHKVVIKHQQKAECAQTSSGVSVELSLLESDEKERLQAAITNLPPMCKQVFIQRKIHNKSHAEIANTFNITTKTVENHIARGLKLCRKFMISSRTNVAASTMQEQALNKGGRK